MVQIPELRTERLRLRTPTLDDAAAIVAGINDLQVSRWLLPVPYPYGLEDAHDFIAQVHAGDLGLCRVIEDDAGLCGCISLDDLVLGFWLATRAWGLGYMSEAVQACLSAHFADPRALPVTSGYFATNARSRHVLTKAGFGRVGGVDLAHCRATGEAYPHHTVILTPEQWHAMHPWVIETDRMRLRPITQDDVPDIARIGGDPRVAPMIFRATVPWPEDVVSNFVDMFRWRGRLGFRMAMELKQSGAMVGTVGVSREPHIFYFSDPAVWGQGLMSEAVQAFVPAILDRFGLSDLGADVFHDNPASAKVLERAGFEKVGEGMGTSAARVEPEPVSIYRLRRSSAKGSVS